MFDLIPGTAALEPQSMPEAGILNLAKNLLARTRKSRHRGVLVIAGEDSWCLEQAHQLSKLPELNRTTWVSTVQSPDLEVVSFREVKGLLGQERDGVVFDAHSGFDPDAFGAISGSIVGGGLLILLCPPLDEWETCADPASERIAVSPYQIEDISGRFIRRFIKVLRQSPAVQIVNQGSPLTDLDESSYQITEITDSAGFSDATFLTRDQQMAVEAIEHVVSGHRKRPAVLVSDRGRGKSSALGFAAARLILNATTRTDSARRKLHIVVTAPQRGSVEALFRHAKQLLPEAEESNDGLLFKDSCIQYIAPDLLCLSNQPADLVLVDEAAAIPAAMLTHLLDKYSRIVFSTTVHGYEGTGRGFAVRFRQTLDEKTPGWNEVKLTTPVRWAENDPLEQLVFRGLLLDAESVKGEEVKDIDVKDVVVECLDREALVNDEQSLSQIFGMLVSAHYKTIPNDLRNLLDGPNISVYVMRVGNRGDGHVVATALVSTEGEFSEELAEEIFSGARRPRGHLIPQSLMVHTGIRQAAQLRCARVMRIAVHPDLQGRGLGSKLIQSIREDVKEYGSHYLGVSFGATPELLQFWKKQNMEPVRAGFRRDHASGEHSVIMLAPLGSPGEELIEVARAHFRNDLPHWLSDGLRNLDVEIAAELLAYNDVENQTGILDGDLSMLEAFAKNARSYEDSSAALWRFLVTSLSRSDDQLPNQLQKKERAVLVSKVLQKRNWADVVSLCGLAGRAEANTVLRTAISKLLDQQNDNAHV